MTFRSGWIVALALVSQASFGAAWLPEPGHGLLIVTARDYRSDRYWDNSRELASTPRYRKTELNPYVEYAVNADFAVGGSVAWLDVSNGNDLSTSGAGDVELFGRYRLRQIDNRIWSAQLSVKTPGGYDENDTPNLGAGQNDIEARLLYGASGEWDAQARSGWYFDVEAALRKRYDEPADEARLDWLVGWRSGDQRWEWQFQQENIVALQHVEAAPDRWSDFDLHKVTPSARYWFTPKTALHVGVTQDVAGRNTGRGTAVFGALWFRF